MKTAYRIMLLAVAVTFICVTLGCKSRQPYAGRYMAQIDKPAPKKILLELKINGTGSWTINSQEVPFRWEVKDAGQIWLHTKGGGVIICNPVGEKLFIDLSGDIQPGGQRLEFTRIPEGGKG